MTEEEAIKICKNIIRSINGDTCYMNYSKEQDKDAISTILDLYKKEKEKNENLGIENSILKQVRTNLINRINMKKAERHSLLQRYDQSNEQIASLKKEIDQLANGIRVLGTNPDITTEEIIKEFTEKPITEEYMEKFENSYISKDKILKALGYEENDEEYKRIYNKEELILSLIRTINEECDRLEDIEDQKVEVAVDFIEEKRDKHWQDKTRKKLEKLKEKEQELSDEQGYFGSSELQARIEELEELLGE